MKNTRIIILSILSLVLLLSVGCQSAAPAYTPIDTASDMSVTVNQEAEQIPTSAETEENLSLESPSKVVYLSGTYATGTYTGLNQSYFEFQSSDRLPVYFYSRSENTVKENVGVTSVQMNDTLMIGNYKRTQVYTEIAEDNSGMKHLREADLYTTTVNGQQVEYLCRGGTNELIRFYGNESISTDAAREDFTSEMATAQANELIVSLYGQEIVDKYTHALTSFDEKSSRYSVAYVRLCHGYLTEDQIIIYYSLSGELAAIVALKKGYVDVYEDRLTEDMIAKAEATLRSAVTEGTFKGVKIMLGADGKCYLRGTAVVEKESTFWFSTDENSTTPPVYEETVLLFIPIEE